MLAKPVMISPEYDTYFIQCGNTAQKFVVFLKLLLTPFFYKTMDE